MRAISHTQIYVHPEMFTVESRENVKFDEFSEADKCSDNFKETLRNFQHEDTKDLLFEAVLFRLLFKSSDGKNEKREAAGEISGK